MELAWNTQKNQMSDVKGKEMEQERKGKISNSDIDLEKTKHNYDFVQSNETLYLRVKKRVAALKESGSRVQKNSVVMYSNILTVPKEQAEIWGEEKTDAYFKACYEFFSKEFGRQNVVSAHVHKDETAPHMHLHFVPVNKENGRLQARISMNKAKINYIHDALPAFLRERDFDVVRGSGRAEKNIDDIHEYKEVQHLKKEVATQKQTFIETLKTLEIYRKPLVDLAAIDKRKFEKGIFNKRIELAPDDFEKLMAMGKENLKLRETIFTVQKERDSKQSVIANLTLDKKVSTLKLKSADHTHAEQAEEIKNLKNEVREVTNIASVYKDILVNDHGFKGISLEEFRARWVLGRLDKGEEPQDKQEARTWEKTLEEARGSQIAPNRLERAIEKVKEIMERLVERVRQRSRGRSR